MIEHGGSGTDPAALWLSQLAGMTPELLRRLLATFGSAAATLRASSSALRAQGVAPAQVAKMVAGQRDVVQVAAGLKGLQRLGIVPLPYGAVGYPDRLLDLPNPPLVIYVQGPWPIGAPLVAVLLPAELDPAIGELWAALVQEAHPHLGIAAASMATVGPPLRLHAVPFGLMLARQRLPKAAMDQVLAGQTTLLSLAPPTAQPTSAAAIHAGAALEPTLGMLVEAVVALAPVAADAHALVAAAQAHGAPVFAFGAPPRSALPPGYRRLRSGKAGLKSLRSALGLKVAGTNAVQQERLF